MIIYLLKMSLCSAVLLLFYRIVLEREKMLRFNRFYLLGSLVISLVLPLVPLEILLQTPVFPHPPEAFTASETAGMHAYTVQLLPQTDVSEYFSWVGLLGVIYLAVGAWMLVRFGRNLSTLLNRIHSHAITNYEGQKLVLLNGPTVPHSFLNYVFVDKADYTNERLEREILAHERAHAQQLHSLDILFVEFLRVIFWFNPALHYYRNAIAMNHEFLADASVMQDLRDASHYQRLLLQKSASPAHLPYISKFNYSFIKKRFVMMHKQTSRTRARLLKIAVLPLLGVAIYVFSDKIMAQKAKPTPAQTMKPKPEPKEYKPQAGISDSELEEYKALVDKYRKTAKPNGDVAVPDDDRQRLVTLDKAMSRAQQGTLNFMILEGSGPLSRNQPTKAEFEKYKDPYTYGVWIDERKVLNERLANYQASDFSQVFLSRLHGKAKEVKGKYKYKFQLDLMTTDYYETYRKESLDKNKDFMYLRTRRIPIKN